MKPFIRIFFVIAAFSIISVSARSYLRLQNPTSRTLIAAWEHDSKTTYEIKSDYLEPYPLFTYETQNLTEDLLPQGEIPFRDGNGAVRGKELSYMIEDLVKEVHAGKKSFTHFKILQSTNFNYGDRCGLLVLQFKEYPFVVKLFIETPETFVNPFNKGAEPIFFWYMGGGAGRHISGLTRIKNLKNVQALTNEHSYWSDHIIFPRKWLWLPNNAKWITLTGKNITSGKTLTNSIPGTFAIIADYINTENSYKMKPKEQQKMVMNYCNDMGLALDPHRKNYSFQKHPEKDEPVMVVVDTEHFPTIVGLKDPTEFETHSQWYRYLMNKGFNDIYMRTKKDRQDELKREHKLALV